MSSDQVDVGSTINRVKALLVQEEGISPAIRSTMEVLPLLVATLLNRLNLNSKNSSKPPPKGGVA